MYSGEPGCKYILKRFGKVFCSIERWRFQITSIKYVPSRAKESEY